MIKYNITVGLNDKDVERQIIKTENAKQIIANIMINKHGIYAYTASDCQGVYKMNSSNNLVYENSIRYEIASDDNINDTIVSIIADIKQALNQESIMLEIIENANILFI